MKNKLLAASAYFFGIPALYIILTQNRNEHFLRPQAEKALKLWFGIFVAFFSVRFLVNWVWSLIYLPYLDLLEVLTAFGLYGRVLFLGLQVLIYDY